MVHFIWPVMTEKLFSLPLTKVDIDFSCTPDTEILRFTPCEPFLSHPRRTCVHVFYLNVGCIGLHVTVLFSAHVTTTSETFNFKMADAIAVFLFLFLFFFFFFFFFFFQCKCYENQASPHLGMQEKESIMRVRYG